MTESAALHPELAVIELVNPFANGVLVAFQKQASTTAQVGKPYVKSNAEITYPIGIASVISLQSDTLQGSAALCFSTPVFLQLYENMFGEKHDQITRETEDAAGELLNIIFGLVKAELNNNHGHTFQRAIPTVLSGKTIIVHHYPPKKPVVILPFTTSAGECHLELFAEHTATP